MTEVEPVHVELGLMPVIRSDPSSVQQQEDQVTGEIEAQNFTWIRILVFFFASVASNSNVNYYMPIVVDLARDFGVKDSAASSAMSLSVAGFGVGLLFIAPLADMYRPKPIILSLIICSLGTNIALALTKSFSVFQAFAFLQGVVSSSHQMLVPISVRLSPPRHHGLALYVVVSGLLVAEGFARMVATLFAQFTDRAQNVFWFGCGIQVLSFTLLVFVLPNLEPAEKNMSILQIWLSLCKVFIHPVVLFCNIGIFLVDYVCMGLWQTFTYLAELEFGFSAISVGLVGLMTIACGLYAPGLGHLADKITTFWLMLMAQGLLIVLAVIWTTSAGLNIAAPIVCLVIADLCLQLYAIAAQRSLQSLDETGRNRRQALFICATIIGEAMGVEFAPKIYFGHGWRVLGYSMLAFWIAATFLVLLRKREPFRLLHADVEVEPVKITDSAKDR